MSLRKSFGRIGVSALVTVLWGAVVCGATEVDVSSAAGHQGAEAIAVDPANPARLLVAGRDALSATPTVYFSANGGTVWSPTALPLAFPVHVYGEGSRADVTVGPTGVWYAAYIVDDPVTGSPTDTTVAVARSFNGTLWDAMGTPQAQCCAGVTDPVLSDPAIAVDTVGCSAYGGRLYVAWVRRSGADRALYVASSTDGGTTWSSPAKVNDGATGTERVFAPRLAVGPGGILYVAWLDDVAKRLYLDRSTNGGASFETDRAAATVTLGCAGGDCGSAPACSGSDLHGATPALAVDTSGSARRGWIYLAFADDLGAGDGLDVLLVRSADGGATWTLPARVNADAAGTGRLQVAPGLSAALSDGSLHAAWYDRRDDASNCATHLYASRSADGGSTWDTEVRITTTATPTFAGSPGEGPRVGVAATDTGAWHAWTDGRLGETEAYAGFAASSNGTRVSGTLATDTTWTAAGGPYFLTGDVTVETGVVLTVQPGTTVYAGPCDALGAGNDGNRTELIVKGVLDAQGTSGSPILFDVAPGASAGAWYGIRFTSTADGSRCRLTYTTVRRAHTAINLEGCSPALDHVTLQGSQYYGLAGSTNPAAAFSPTSLTISGTGGEALAMNGGSGGTWKDLHISGCSGGAGILRGGTTALRIVGALVQNNTGPSASGLTVATPGGSAEILHSTFSGNSGTGLRLDGEGARTVASCSMTGNAAAGLALHNTASGWQKVSVHWNDLSGNGAYALLMENGSLPADVRRNWWGAATTAEMSSEGYPSEIAALYDIQDNGGLRHADYQLWESSAVATAPDLESHLVVPATVAEMQLRIAGAAVADAGVKRVEISIDSGPWDAATCTGSAFYYDWFPSATGPHTIRSRVVNQLDQVEGTPDQQTVTVSSGYTDSGALIHDEVWSGSVTLLGDIFVPSGNTLTIQAGTQVRFTPLSDATFSGYDPSRIEIIVAGNLVVDGVAVNRASFDSARAVPLAGDWYGVRFLDSSNDLTSRITGGDLAHGVQAVRLESAAPDLVDSLFRNGSSDGLWGSSGSLSKALWTFSGCTVSGNGGAGATLTIDTEVSASGDTFASNGGTGLYLNAGSHPATFLNLVSHHNSQAGVTVQAGSSGVILKGADIHSNGGAGVSIGSGGSGVRVESCQIQNNTGAGVQVDSASTFTVLGSTITGNTGGLRTGSPRLVAAYNTLSGNLEPVDGGSGLRAYADSGTPSVLGMNTLDDAGAAEVYLAHPGSDSPGRALNARRNYWGATTTAQMVAAGYPADIGRLRDIRDDRSAGLVDYRNWLSSAPAVPGAAQAHITYPSGGQTLNARSVLLTGVAFATAGVDHVEVSTDGGSTWGTATGKEAWTFEWFPPSAITYPLQARVVPSVGGPSTPSETLSVTITQNVPTTSGPLVSDEVWGPGEVLLTGDVTVRAGVTLTLQPGTTVKAAALTDERLSGDDPSRVELIVQGTLAAPGTLGAHVVFTSDAAAPAARDWYGLRFEDTSDDGASLLAHVDVGSAWHGLELEDAGPALSEVTSSGNHRHGLFVHHLTGQTFPAAVALSGGSLTGNGGCGAYVGDALEGPSSFTLEGVTLRQNARDGVTASLWGGDLALTFKNLTILQNGWSGVDLNLGNGATFSQVLLQGCLIDQNGRWGADLLGGALQVFGNTFTNQATAGYDALSVGSTTTLDLYKNTFASNRTNLRLGNYLQRATVTYNDFGATSSVDNPGAHTSAGYGGPVPRFHYNNWGDAASGTIFEAGPTYGANAWGNYWGAATTAEIASKGYPANITTFRDIEDEASRGRIDYSRNLSAPSDLSPSRQSHFLNPVDGATLTGRSFVLQGSAGADAGIDRVEFSTTGLAGSWAPAVGRASWSYLWTPSSSGDYTLYCRVVDLLGTPQAPATSILVHVSVANVTTTGTLIGDESWSGVIVLTGDVTVPAGVTLTLQPGVVVKASPLTDDTNGGYDTSRIELILKGRLVAHGTVSSPITLGSNGATPAAGDWFGLRFESTTDSTQTLEYVTVEYARRGISSRDASNNTQDAYPDLSHCTVRFTTEEGVMLSPGGGGGGPAPVKAALTIADCTVTDSAEGLRIDFNTGNTAWSEVTFHLLRNTLTRSGGPNYYNQALQFRQAPSGSVTAKRVEVSGNTVTGAPQGAIYVGTSYWYGQLTELVVEDNTISDSMTGIQVANLNIAGGSVSRNTVTGGTEGINLLPIQHARQEGNVLSGGTGIGFQPCHGAVVGNRVTGYASHGLFISDRGVGSTFGTESTDVMLYNTITGNGGDGLRADSVQYPSALVRIHGSDLSGNAGKAVQSGPESISWGQPCAVDARGNWWGAAATAEMAGLGYPANITAIRDIEDDTLRARVDYRDWLTSAPAAPSALQSRFVWPRNGDTLSLRTLTLEGTAFAAAGLKRVEVSTDGGTTWVPASGTDNWAYTFTPAGGGTLTLRCRVVDLADAVEDPAPSITVTVDADAPTTTGSLLHDETWSGLVTLTGDVTVPAGTVLTLLPGTIVRCAPLTDDLHGGQDTSRIELIVAGRLTAVGTATDGITLTSASVSPAAGHWFGLRYKTGCDYNAGLSRVTLEYARKGIYAKERDAGGNLWEQEAYPDLSFCTFRFLSEEALVVTVPAYNGSGPPPPTKSGLTVADCTFHACGRGLQVEVRYGAGAAWGAFTHRFLRNTFTSIGTLGQALSWRGVETFTAAALEVSGNTFTSCAGGAVELDPAVYYGSLTVTDLRLEDNAVSGGGTAFNFGDLWTPAGLFRGNTVTGGTDGLVATPYQTLRVEDNTFTGGSGTGIQFGHGQLLRTTVDGYGGTGVRFANNWPVGSAFGTSADDVVLFCDILDNQGHGLVDAGGMAQSSARVHFANILNNVGDAARQDYTAVLDARHNWWGTSMTDEMVAKGYPANILKIYDVEDDLSRGRVDYSGWLAAPVDTAVSLTSRFVAPPTGATLSRSALSLEGVAYAAAGIDRVEVSTNDGLSWNPATGTYHWTYAWTPPAAGAYTLRCRTVAVGGAVEDPGDSVSVTVSEALPTTSGTLSRDETWSGTVNLTGDILIPAGRTLTLSAGTQVKCAPWSDDRHGGIDPSRIELLVEGRLVSNGTEGSPVVVTTASSSPARGQWYGIRYLPLAPATQALSRCNLSWGVNGVSNAITNDGNTFTGYPDLLNCRIEQMSRRALDGNIRASATKGLWTVSGNTFANTTEMAVFIALQGNPDGGLTVRFTDNQVTGFGSGWNGVGGVAIYMWDSRPDHRLEFLRNTVAGTSPSYPVFLSRAGWSPPWEFMRVAGCTLSTTRTDAEVLNVSAVKQLEVVGNTVSGGNYAARLSGSSYTRAETVWVQGNRFQGATNIGLRLEYYTAAEGTAAVLEDNAFINNTGNGLELYNSGATTLLRRNNFGGNGAFALANHSSGAVDAAGNYWGAATTSEMVAKGCDANIVAIEDQRDNGGWGLVTYCDWAASPFGDQATITFGGTLASRTLHWVPKSGVTYDLIRGDRASLSLSGGVVHLGAVTCQAQADGSGSLSDTSGNPPAGACWFYLLREHAPTVGAYGYSSANQPEVPDSGGCP